MPDLAQILLQRRLDAMHEKAPDPYQIMAHPDEDYMREDGTKKGQGFLGMLPVQDGVMSEFSIGDTDDPKEWYPSIVPTLNAAELNQVMNFKVSPHVEDKARAYMLARKLQGKPAFAQDGEQQYDTLPMFRRIK